MTMAIDVFQALLLILAAPLVRGIVARIKAGIQGRRGASIWRPYADVLKMFRKEDLAPPSASAVFRFAPRLLFAVAVAVAAFVPVLQPSALLGSLGDFIVMVYLMALGRFFLALGGMDGGSAFGGMGASREALVSTLAEAPFLLSMAALSISAHSPRIADIVGWTLGQDFFDISAVHILAFASMGMVALAESGRMPVDNPTTHLELTMIHEAMVLEYSGPSLALIEWASAIKLNVMLALLIALFGPWGMATHLAPVALGSAFGVYLLKMLLLMTALAVIESSVAKLRMYLVPDFLGVATATSVLAIIFTVLSRR
jgi:formate hydrogenlyase subunit 4